MSRQACLFAEDHSAPYNPEASSPGRDGATHYIAGCAYQIPVFWLFCFDSTDFVDVPTSGGLFSVLVTETAAARRRLRERDPLARELFPAHIGAWELWCRVIDVVDRKFLKLNPSEICAMYDDAGTLEGELSEALDWFRGRRFVEEDSELTALLSLAGIMNYDCVRHSFTPVGGHRFERYVYGGLDIVFDRSADAANS